MKKSPPTRPSLDPAKPVKKKRLAPQPASPGPASPEQRRPLPRFGAHCSIAGGHAKALALGKDIGCEVAQIFTKNNMRWFGTVPEGAALNEYRQARLEWPPGTVFAHSGYLINPASPAGENRDRSRASLLAEMELCHLLELPFLVLHPGAHLGQGEAEGLRAVTETLDWVLERAPGTAQIALEATAGAGTILGHRLEHLATLLESSRHSDRLSICLDTCHLFAAGYDLRGAAGWANFRLELARHFPWSRVVCIHINDSQGPLGGNKDRHAILGEGQIGWELFATMANDASLAAIPLCLETPKDPDYRHDRETLQRLKQARH